MAVYHGEIKYASVSDAAKALGPVAVMHRDGKTYVWPLNSEPPIEADIKLRPIGRPRHIKRY
jgi:hypothetical protein